jgi:DNA replication and repair protein RecF
LWVARLELLEYRSYRRAELDLTPGVTVFVGANGRGKTNLLEALHRVAIGASHRVATDAPLLRVTPATKRDGEDADGQVTTEAIIRTVIVTDDERRRTVDLQLGPGRTRVKVDGQTVRRAADALGVLRVISFAPEDLTIVRGDPSDRRRFLDQVLSQRRASYASALSEYDRVLRQRNALLREQRGAPVSHGDDDTLSAWTQQLVAHGAPLIAARVAAVTALRGPVQDALARLTDDGAILELSYQTLEDDPSPPGDVHEVAQRLHALLAARAGEERRRGTTLAGPHRDDLLLTLAGLPARVTASQGEAWSIALACKVGATELLTGVGDRPVLLLDDVFSELDETRRRRVAALCVGFDQVLVTAAVDADVPLEGRRVEVGRDDDELGTVLRPRSA